MAFFKGVLNNAGNMEKQLLGPTYKYYQQVNTPAEMGMSGDGNLGALSKDIAGIINYVNLLVSGKGRASRTGKPLGNKFFLKVGGQCKDNKSGELVDRYIYVNNIPLGNVPFISAGVGANFSEFEGLVPGVLSNMNALNPMAIFGAFMEGDNPPCRDLTMEVIDNNNNISTQTHFVTDFDVANIDSCAFTDGHNPVTGEQCRMAFTNMKPSGSKLENIYMLSISCLVLYLMYKYMRKRS